MLNPKNNERMILLSEFVKTFGNFPTYDQMTTLFCLKSRGATFKWCKNMVKYGFLNKHGKHLQLVDNRLSDAIYEALLLIKEHELWLSENSTKVLVDHCKALQ